MGGRRAPAVPRPRPRAGRGQGLRVGAARIFAAAGAALNLRTHALSQLASFGESACLASAPRYCAAMRSHTEPLPSPGRSAQTSSASGARAASLQRAGPSVAAGRRVVLINELEQRLPWHSLPHLIKEDLAPGVPPARIRRVREADPAHRCNSFAPFNVVAAPSVDWFCAHFVLSRSSFRTCLMDAVLWPP